MMRKLLISLSLALLPVLLPAQESKENADFKLALNLYNDGFHDLALEQFRQFVSFYPTTQQGIEARFYLGMSQFALERFDESRLTFQNFALSYADHPRAPEAWESVGNAYLAEGNKRDAALSFERIHTFHPRSRLAPGALQKAADLFDELADRESSLRVLKVLSQEYARAGVYAANLRLAELYVEAGQFDAANIEIRKVIENSQETEYRGRALFLQAGLLLRRERTIAARTALIDIRTNYKSSTAFQDAMFALASLYYAEGNVPEAISTWTALAEDADVPDEMRQRAEFEIGVASEATMDVAGASRSFESAAARTGPLLSSASYRAGRIKEISGDTVGAARLYERAAADTSRSDDLLLRLIGGVKSGRWQHRPDMVALNASRLERVFPDHIVVPRVMLLWAFEELETRGDAERAEDLFRSVLRHPGGGYVKDRALLGLARSLSASGYPEKAIESYEDLHRLYPASPVRETSMEEQNRMLTFTVKDRDAGTQQLALLLGDVISEQSRSMLAFRLAEISFLQLKNFALAHEQYARALESDLAQENRPIAWFHRGASARHMADATESGGDDRTRLMEESRTSYERILLEHAEHPLAQEAFIQITELAVDMGADEEELATLASRADTLRLAGGAASQVWRWLGFGAEKVSAPDKALAWYGKAFQASRDDVLSGELLWKMGFLHAQSGEQDTAYFLLTRSFGEFGVHPFMALAGTELARLASERGDAAAVGRITEHLVPTFAYAVDAPALVRYRADAEYTSGRFSEAFGAYSDYRSAIQSDPFDPKIPSTVVVFRMALSAQRSGKHAEALRLYGEVIGRKPDADILLEAYYAIASLSELMGDLARASQAMQEASRIAGEAGGDVEGVALQSADLLFRNEQYQPALAKYGEVQAATASDSLRNALEARIIVCHFRLENLREADRRATAYVQKNPGAAHDAAEFEFERAKHHTRQGRLTQARNRFEIVIRQYPGDPLIPQALFWLGRSHELGQQPDSAAMMYDSLLRQHPTADIVPRVELSLGNAYYTLEQWDKAAPLYKKLVDNADRSPGLVQYAMNNLILTYKELSLFDGALQLTRRYIQEYPEDPDLINKRIDVGVLYQKLGYYDQSVVHLQDLLLTAPSEFEAELRYYIGEAYYYKGDHQQAILEFLKVPYLVVRRGPIDWVATSYYMAGQAYEKMSRFDQAIAMYQQIIDRNGIDAQFKTAAQREIDRVRSLDRN
jgi:TolA-binding protein